MRLTQQGAHSLTPTRSLLKRLIELPDLARVIQSLPVQAFAALVREVGLEDAGEFVALATREQLVHAFDEDLFVSDRAGERETLDASRWVVWLELLLEAGDGFAAARIAELDEDFVAHALSSMLLVLDEEALRERLADSDEDESCQVDKAFESALTEEIDGYILVATQHEGWGAALALICALDRDHRPLLVRLLDHLARLGSKHLDDLAELSTVLSESESLAEDAEAAREERRAKLGYVEARAARAFLTLARKPTEHDPSSADRDPLTRAYFRELERSRPPAQATAMPGAGEALSALPPAIQRELDHASAPSARLALPGSPSDVPVMSAFTAALRELSRSEPQLFERRMEEFAYLINVLLAGHERDGARLRPKAAADAVLATVCYGAVAELRARRAPGRRREPPASSELAEVLRLRAVDLLFRRASSALVAGAAPRASAAQETGLLYSAEELEAALRQRSRPSGSRTA